jgi:hypothetical protein
MENDEKTTKVKKAKVPRVPKEPTIWRKLTPTEVAKAVKESLIKNPAKKLVFTSFGNAMGIKELDILIEHINIYKESIKEKRIKELREQRDNIGKELADLGVNPSE